MDALPDPPPPHAMPQSPVQRAARPGLRRRELGLLAVFFVFAVLVAVNFKRVEVSGISMEPTYQSGDLVTVWKTVPRASLKPGDVIVFKSADGDELIKRIAAIQSGPFPRFPAWLEMDNGRREAVRALFDPQFSPYFARLLLRRIPPPAPDHIIYVLGDNLPRSDDSRDFGPISARQILGKVIP